MHDIFFFTDVHGNYKLFQAAMLYCIRQDPDCHIIYGGDACDRGPDGYKIMKELLEHPQVTYLKGNHEDMFTKAAREIKNDLSLENLSREEIESRLKACSIYDYKYEYVQTSLYNGGLSTLTDWILDGMPIDLIEKIEQLPLIFTYGMLDFCHSACVYKTFDTIATAEYYNHEPKAEDVEQLLWGRTGLNYTWKRNRTAIFGHTPVQYLKRFIHLNCEDKPVKYIGKYKIALDDNGPKIDMDVCTKLTNKLYVLNCLTMKAQGFELKSNDVEEIEVIQF